MVLILLHILRKELVLISPRYVTRLLPKRNFRCLFGIQLYWYNQRLIEPVHTKKEEEILIVDFASQKGA